MSGQRGSEGSSARMGGPSPVCLITGIVWGTAAAVLTGVTMYRRAGSTNAAATVSRAVDTANAAQRHKRLPVWVGIVGGCVGGLQMYTCRRDEEERRQRVMDLYQSRNYKLYGQRHADLKQWSRVPQSPVELDPGSEWYSDLKALTEYKLPKVSPAQEDPR